MFPALMFPPSCCSVLVKAASLRVLFPADGPIGMEVTEVGQRHDRVGVDRPQAVPRRAGISRGLVITELNGIRDTTRPF
jgi:hypothetical protein